MKWQPFMNSVYTYEKIEQQPLSSVKSEEGVGIFLSINIPRGL